MSVFDTILPFPANIDRAAFGQWLSGFVDGEGYFGLRASYIKGPKSKHAGRIQMGHAAFAIQLRADDKPILELIRSYWGYGALYRSKSNPRPGSDTKPRWSYRVSCVERLYSVVVPHFERYPLFAKKKTDYLIWKEGVEMIHRISQRPNPGRSGKTKWLPEDIALYDALAAKIRSGRLYNESLAGFKE